MRAIQKQQIRNIFEIVRFESRPQLIHLSLNTNNQSLNISFLYVTHSQRLGV